MYTRKAKYGLNFGIDLVYLKTPEKEYSNTRPAFYAVHDKIFDKKMGTLNTTWFNT